MDFFQTQEQARKKTLLLIALFVLAVLLIIVGVYATLTLVAALMTDETTHYAERQAVALWSPGRAIIAAVAVLAIVGFSAGSKIASFSRGGSAVAESLGGRRIEPGTKDPAERRLFNVVEEMAIASGLPVPAVYLLEKEEGINGFAAGNRPDDAAIALTRGALEALDRDELQGVVAHEFSHILNGDMRLNIRLAGVLFGLLVLSILGTGLLRAAFHGSLYRGMSRRGGRSNNGGLMVLAIIGIALFVLGLIGQFFGRLIQAAISRQREFLADSAAVQFTRNPSGISGALQQIGAASKRGKVEDSEAQAVAHLFFANAISARYNGLLASHPPLPERIRAIDPSWDGEFSPRKIRSKPPARGASAGKGREEQRPTPRGVFGQGAQGMGSAAALAAFLNSVGTVSPEAVDRARALLEKIPEVMAAAVHDPEGAPAVVACLLLSEKAEVRGQQLKLVRKEFSDAVALNVTRMYPHVWGLEETGRMPVLELCLPALKQGLSNPAAFIEKMRALADVDGQFHLFECLILAVLEARLRAGTGKEEGKAKLDGPAASRVLSGFATIEARDDVEAASILESAVTGANLPTLSFSPPANNAALEADLVKLRALSLGDRKAFLSAAARIVWHDGKVSRTEGEWLRALGAILECPVPSLAEG